MPRTSMVHAVTTIGMDMGKNTLHMIGLDSRGAIVMREKVSRGRITSRLANVPSCLIGIEAGMATHYVARELAALGHDVKQVPPTYAKPFRQGHKNDFRDAHAVAEAVQRPTTRFVPVKTDEQLDLQALHRVRSRLVSERTAVINQIRGFLLERGIIIRQGLRFLRQLLPDILAKRTDVLSPRMVRIVADLASDWRQLDERIEPVTDEIETLAKSPVGFAKPAHDADQSGVVQDSKTGLPMSAAGHERPRWSRPRFVHVRFGSDSDRDPSKRDPALRATSRLMHCNKIGWFRNWSSGMQRVEQRLGLLQIERVEAFGEPAVKRSKKIASRIPFALIAPKPRHAHRCA